MKNEKFPFSSIRSWYSQFILRGWRSFLTFPVHIGSSVECYSAISTTLSFRVQSVRSVFLRFDFVAALLFAPVSNLSLGPQLSPDYLLINLAPFGRTPWLAR
jgi:hypothetical protein